jgi:hypothetical protein
MTFVCEPIKSSGKNLKNNERFLWSTQPNQSYHFQTNLILPEGPFNVFDASRPFVGLREHNPQR